MSVTYGGSNITFGDGSSIGSGTTGFRNRVINGGMRIDQRNSGASVSAAGNAGSVPYPVDRTFVFNYTGTGSTTVTGQQVSVSENIGFDYAIRATIGTTSSRGSNYDARFQHNIEGNIVSDYIPGTTTITVTFWARASKSGYAYYSIWSSASSIQFTKRISLTTSWQKFQIDVPASPSNFALYKDTRRGFGTGLYWAQSGWVAGLDGTWSSSWGGALTDDFSSSGDWIEFTGYQLEFGSGVSNFEWRPYTTELDLCQRYFERVYCHCGIRNGSFGGWSHEQTEVDIPFKVLKRVTPSVTYINYGSNISGTPWVTRDFQPGTTLGSHKINSRYFALNEYIYLDSSNGSLLVDAEL